MFTMLSIQIFRSKQDFSLEALNNFVLILLTKCLIKFFLKNFEIFISYQISNWWLMSGKLSFSIARTDVDLSVTKTLTLIPHFWVKNVNKLLSAKTSMAELFPKPSCRIWVVTKWPNFFTCKLQNIPDVYKLPSAR